MSKQVKALRMIETPLLLKCAASHSGFLNEQGGNFRKDGDLEMLGDFRPGLPKPIPKSIPNKEMNLSIYFLRACEGSMRALLPAGCRGSASARDPPKQGSCVQHVSPAFPWKFLFSYSDLTLTI